MQPYNLDDGVSEYFQFILKGNLYNFRYPTSKEMQEFGDIEDQETVKKILIKFVTKVDPKAPEFIDLLDQMTVPVVLKFKEMINKEMNPNENNQSPKGT